MRKFKVGEFFKHRGDCCDFIEIQQVVKEDDVRVEIRATWYTQRDNYWKLLTPSYQFSIMISEVGKWRSYKPKGERR